MPNADCIRRELEGAQQELIDLTLRNRMLNYRELKARGVEIIEDTAPRVHELLSGGTNVGFLPFDVTDDSSGTGIVPFDPEIARLQRAMVDQAAKARGAVLQTPYDAKKLYARLLATFRSARTLLQEQGTSNLFLALGMLEWYEDSSSSQPLYAPLAFLPAQLERAGVKERFHLQATGDDPQPNPSLQAKLKSLGINLPMFEAEEDFDLTSYYREVAHAIGDEGRWSIHPNRIALGFFSFSRYLMYLDLSSDTWDTDALASHPIINDLLCAGFKEADSPIDDAVRLDEQVAPEDLALIMDADSSQVSAVVDVVAGRNLVIEGPPGTGKSQTIANVIADAVKRGKTVLFVSEKMAALEVVKRRLEANGLGHIALELHSQKARKRDVLDELKRTLERDPPAPVGSTRTTDKLWQAITYLNSYDDAVNTPLPGPSIPPIKAFGHIVDPDPVLDDVTNRVTVAGWQDWTSQDLEVRRKALRQLSDWITNYGKPSEHPYWGSATDSVLPEHERAALTHADQLYNATQELSEQAQRAAQALPEALWKTPKNAASLLRTAGLLRKAPPWSPFLRSEAWSKVDPQALEDALQAGATMTALRERHDEHLRAEAWTADVDAIKNELEIARTWLQRLFSTRHRRALRDGRRLCKTGIRMRRKELLETIGAIEQATACREALSTISDVATELFGNSLHGNNADFASLKETANWRLAVRRGLEEDKLDGQLLTWAEDNAIHNYTEAQQDALQMALANYRPARTALAEALNFDEVTRFGEGQLPARTYNEHFEFIKNLQQHTTTWRHLAQYWGASHEATALGLGSFEGFATYDDNGKRVAEAFDRWWYQRVAEQALGDRPELSHFDRHTHEAHIQEHSRLDQRYLLENRSTIASTHFDKLPRSAYGGQVGTLHHEFNKQRRHLPVRRLIQRAGNAVQAIKPVFMMSPLSVAQFIPPDSIAFDLVVFDEASQVRPAEALGALIRGRQAVVVGDSKQLPPTDFFNAIVNDDDDIDDNDDNDDSGQPAVANIESILGMFRSKQAPYRMLKWHYRSRHESLIAVSNQKFYDNQLLIFPSPAGQHDGLGLVLHHDPNTVYDRGASRTNREEARAVAEAVMRHAQQDPDLSLGVAAFSNAQATAIEDEVERLRRQHDDLEKFFDNHQHEPFFVKNLETVQGDERDVIYISVGYGRDTSGRLTRHFGPLIRAGGERRLNVLITRAKRRCEIFTNINADDIAGDPAGIGGVPALKAFLKYAQTGKLDYPQASDREPDSPFELAVANALRSRGYTVDTQVGVVGFFIDLGVVDPSAEGRYLLGIECDGATYHSARSARERDRLRQDVLEGLGWHLHRVWSTDWFRDPATELERAVRAIEEAKAAPPSPRRPPPTASRPGSRREPRTQPAPTSQPLQYPGSNGAVPYNRSRVEARLHAPQELHQVSASTMARWLKQVVDQEGPVHNKLARMRIMDAVGVRQEGSRIRAAISRGIGAAEREGLLSTRGAFLWPRAARELRVRTRADMPNNERKFAYVPPEEVDLAVKHVLQESHGMTRAETPQAVTDLLGFGRLSKPIHDTIRERVGRLEATGVVIEQGGFLILGPSA